MKFESKKRRSRRVSRTTLFYEGEGDSSGDSSGDGGTSGDSDDGGAGKTFTQSDVDRMIQARVGKITDQNRTLLQQMETLQKQTGDNEALEAEIEQLRQRTLSQEELERRAQEKAEKELNDKLTEASSARDSWRSQFEGLKKSNDIMSAMAAGEIDPPMYDVAATYIGSMTEIQFNETGQASTVVKMPSTDKEGNAVVLELTPAEAIKTLRDSGTMANLFKGAVRPGIGQDGKRTGQAGDPMELDMESYSKLPPEERYR